MERGKVVAAGCSSITFNQRETSDDGVRNVLSRQGSKGRRKRVKSFCTKYHAFKRCTLLLSKFLWVKQSFFLQLQKFHFFARIDAKFLWLISAETRLEYKSGHLATTILQLT